MTEEGIHSHGREAEALGVCIQMLGGPGTVYGPRAFAAFRSFMAPKE